MSLSSATLGCFGGCVIGIVSPWLSVQFPMPASIAPAAVQMSVA
jgi:hypothetical protein